MKHHFTNQDIQIQTYVLLAKNTLNQLKRMKKYRPLPSYLEVKKSKIEGLGLFAVRRIEAGKEIGTTHYDLHGEIWDELMRTPLGGFLNHSDNPNCVLDKTSDSIAWILHTLKEIKRGEELTVKYELYEVNK